MLGTLPDIELLSLGETMSLEDYKVDRDKFVEAKNDMTILCFPCYCCLYRNKSQEDEPCRTCGHNLLSVEDDE